MAYQLPPRRAMPVDPALQAYAARLAAEAPPSLGLVNPMQPPTPPPPPPKAPVLRPPIRVAPHMRVQPNRPSMAWLRTIAVAQHKRAAPAKAQPRLGKSGKSGKAKGRR